MSSFAFSALFVGFLVLTLLVRFWLGSRHIRHILTHRGAVPPEFAEKVPLYAHQKAADYTVARTRFGLLTLLANSAVLIGFTLLGGLQWLSVTLFQLTGPGMSHQLALLAAFAFISAAVELPFDYYRQVAEDMGFLYVAAGPLVRSSYRAAEFFLRGLMKRREANGGSGASNVPPT